MRCLIIWSDVTYETHEVLKNLRWQVFLRKNDREGILMSIKDKNKEIRNCAPKRGLFISSEKNVMRVFMTTFKVRKKIYVRIYEKIRERREIYENTI